MNLDQYREALAYDPVAGTFTWLKVPKKGPARVGAVAGSVNGAGYWQISFGRTVVLGHRLAFLYMTGQWPQQRVDHKNGVRADNRWDNLRDAPPSTNNENVYLPRSDNRLGRRGVWRINDGRKRPYVAEIGAQGVKHRLGYFATPDEASQAYLRAKLTLQDGALAERVAQDMGRLPVGSIA